jgi:hypothetical protein
MVFTETSLDVEVNLPSEGYPLQKNVVEIKLPTGFSISQHRYMEYWKFSITE